MNTSDDVAQAEYELEVKRVDSIEEMIKSMPKHNTVQVQVTPFMARHLLEQHNFNNRPPKPKSIKHYAKLMLIPGAWKITADSVIIFSKTGRMLNGQNRLLACIRADTSFLTLMSFNEENENYEVMDNGVARTAADILASQGVLHYTKVAAAIKCIEDIKYSASNSKGKADSKLQRDEVAALYPQYSELSEDPYIHVADMLYKYGWQHSVIMGLHYLFIQADPKKAEEFMQAFIDRNPDHKYGALRKMQNYIDSIKSKLGSVDGEIKKAALVTAWNLFLNNKVGTAGDFEWNPKFDRFPTINATRRSRYSTADYAKLPFMSWENHSQ